MLNILSKLLPSIRSPFNASITRRWMEQDATKQSMINPLFKDLTSAIKKPEEKAFRRLNPHYQDRRVQFGSTGNFRYSLKKLNLLARQIRGLNVKEAILQMKFSNKGPAKRIGKMLHDTQSHAVNHQKFDLTRTIVKEAYVGKGLYFARVRLHARGRAGKMHHKQVHMKVVLEELPQPLDTPQLEKLKTILKKQKLRDIVTMDDRRPLSMVPPPWSLRQRI